MPTNIIRSEIRFRNNVMNSPFFKGSYSNTFVGAAGLQYYIEQDVSLDWDSGYIDGDSGWLVNNPLTSKIFKREDGGNFITDGFAVNERTIFFTVVKFNRVSNIEFVPDDTVDSAFTADLTTTSVTNDTIIFSADINLEPLRQSLELGGAFTVTLDSVYESVFMGAAEIKGFELGYSFNENNERYTGLSLIDGSKTSWYTNSIGASSATLLPFSSEKKSNRTEREAATILRRPTTGKTFRIKDSSFVFTTVQNFQVYQVVELPDYIEAWYDNITGNTQPTEYLNGQSLKYANQLNFYSSYANTASRKTTIFDTEVGNQGWKNELFNGGENRYSLTSISYTDSNNDPINSIDIGGCSFSMEVKSNGFAFASDPVQKALFCLRINSLKNSSEYENNADYYDANVLRDLAYVGYNDSNTGGLLIKNLVCTPIDTYNVTITGDIDFTVFNNEYPDKIPNEGDLYQLGVYCSTNKIDLGVDSGSTTVSNYDDTFELVYLNVDVGSYLKNTDISGLWLHDRFEIFDHPTNTDQEGYTGLKGWVEDGIVLFAQKKLKRGAFIESIKIACVAEKQSDKSYFIIDEYNLDTSQQVFPTGSGAGYTQWNINEPVGYNLNENDQFNRLIVSTVGSVSTYAPISFYIPYKIPWQSWQRLEDADTVFYENDPQNEFGLNRNASRYSGVNDYEVKLYLIANIEYEGIVTEYIDRSPVMDVNYYDLPSGFTNVITTETEDAVDLTGAIQTDKTTIIKAVFTKVAHGLVANELYGIIRLEEQRSEGVGINEISTIREGYPTSPLIPITGDYASITVDTDTITVTCKTNIDFINDEPYRLSAKIGAKVSAPLTGDYNQDYNNDYDNL